MEIKFRAWEIKSGCYFKYNQYAKSFSVFDLINDELGMFGDCITGRKDEYTLEQFTGLKDKNGTDIYDGDIVKTREDYEGDYLCKSENFKVYFEEGEFLTNCGLVSWPDDCEIIGNIHENPELLR